MERDPLPVFVAYQARVREELASYLEQLVQPDRRLKDPEKIQQSVQDRRAELRDKLSLCRFCCELEEIRAMLPSHGLAVQIRRETVAKPATEFVSWLSGVLGSAWTSWSSLSPPCCFLGFGVVELLPILAAGVGLEAGGQQFEAPYVPADFWHTTGFWTPRFVQDPLKVLLPSTLQNVLPPEQRWPVFLSLCAQGLAGADQPLPGLDLEKDLNLVFALAAKYQMVKVRNPVFFAGT